MVHGRNFDYPEQYIRSVIVSVGFVKGGAELYRGSLILPIIGIVDGIRPNVCSVSVNTRHKNSHQQPVGAKADKFSSFEGGVVGLLKVIPTPLHVLDRISPIFSPFSRFLRVFTVSTRRFQRAQNRNPGPRNRVKGAQTPFRRPS
eukprot:COSAG04_NODE_346_length_16127_cov_10.497442_15_plen_145_part_00